MSLSIIIPVCQDGDGLKVTVNTLLVNNPEMVDFEVILCIDGGCEVDVESAQDLISCYSSEKITYQCVMPNKGSYNARNVGAENATGDVFAFLDADVYVQKGWYEALQKEIQKYDYIAGSVEIPWAWAEDAFEQYESITGFPVEKYLREIRFGPTANMVVKRAVFKDVGGFDSRLRSGGDVVFGKQVFNKGYSQFFAPDMKVLHKPRNKKEVKKKIDRVTKGGADRQKYHPELFKKKYEIHSVSFVKSLLRIMLFPLRYETRRSGKLSWIDFVITESTVAYYLFLSRVRYL